MKKKKPKSDEDYDDSLKYIIGTGSYDGFTEVPKDDKPQRKRQIGFIRKNDNPRRSKRAGK